MAAAEPEAGGASAEAPGQIAEAWKGIAEAPGRQRRGRAASKRLHDVDYPRPAYSVYSHSHIHAVPFERLRRLLDNMI